MAEATIPSCQSALPIERPIPPAAVPVWMIIAAMAMLAAAIVWPSPLSYDGATLDTVWLFFIALAAIGALLRRRGLIAVAVAGIAIACRLMPAALRTGGRSPG